MNVEGRTARAAFIHALSTFTLFRGALFAFDYVAIRLVPKFGTCRPQWEVFGPGNDFWNGFFRWDGGWYRNIVFNGYTFRNGPSSVAFYPLYPYLSRWLGVVVGSPYVAGLLISNVATLIGVYYLMRLGEQLFDRETADRAGMFVLIFPSALFLSAFYTEGLFFCFAAASMAYFYRERYVTAGLLGGLSMLTRSSGLVLFAGLALELFVKLVRRQTRFRASMLGLLLIPAGLGVFMLIQKIQVGDPLAFTKTMKNWGRVSSFPWTPLIDKFSLLRGGLPEKFERVQDVIDATTAVVFLGIGAAMIVLGYPLALGTMVVTGVLLPLTTYNLASMGRYVLALFPAFFWLGSICRNRPALERVLTVVSALLLAVYSLRFMRCGWAG